jgi:phosphoserine phosphatase
VKIAAFDLDGTLLRRMTVCEAIAKGIGRIERMREFEQLGSNQIEGITAAREEMASWYSAFTFSELRQHLTTIPVAPGVDEGFRLLHDHGFKIAIVSVTWKFAVEWFANEFGADYSVGTGLSPEGLITHFWPQDKAAWLSTLAANLDVSMRDVAAVGDSTGDIPMLLRAGHGFWVGEFVPAELDKKIISEPEADIRLVARKMIDALK